MPKRSPGSLQELLHKVIKSLDRPTAMPRFQTAGFHVETGPASLFERVGQKMAGKHALRLHADRFQTQAAFRRAPIDSLREFDPSVWDLATVEVRTDTGKFVNSSWTRSIEGRRWWLVIGLHDAVVTVIDTEKRGLSSEIVLAGELYEKVEETNRALVDGERDSGG